MKFSLSFLVPVLFCASLAAVVAVTGCGGGGKSGSVPASIAPSPDAVAGNGRATLTIFWTPRPEEASRLIPIATRSLRVLIQKIGGETVLERVILRPAGQNETTETFEGLPLETLRVVATARPQEDGNGTPQAGAEVLVVVRADENAPIRVRLESTITRLDVVADKAEAPVGEPVGITVSAKNDAGELVMIGPETQTWSVTGEGYRSGNSAVTGMRIGTTRVEVRETESGKSGVAEVSFTRSAEYSVREIIVPDGYSACKPTGITNDGYVVGHCLPEGQLPRSFAWRSSDGRWAGLPAPSGYAAFAAVAVSQAKKIVGDGWKDATGADAGFLMTNETEFTPLQRLEGGPNRVTDINERGEIIGQTVAASSQLTLWEASGAGRVLDRNPNAARNGRKINNSGWIVGEKEGKAALWYADGTPPVRLSDLRNQPDQITSAFGVNNAGKIAGQYASVGRLIVWDSPSSPARFEPSSATMTSAVGMNLREEVVGYSTFSEQGMLVRNGVVRTFANLLPPNTNLRRMQPTCLNDPGQIAGTAERDGKKTLFLLTPQGGGGDLKVGVR